MNTSRRYVTIWILIAGSITLVSSVAVIIVLIIYYHKKSKRLILWQTPTSTPSVINSEPISRRTSSTCLINLDKQAQQQQQQQPRSRSASFSEDLTARLQLLASGNTYRSYSPAIITSSSRSTRSSLSANIRFPSISSPPPSTSNIPLITFQLRYEQTIETLFITIFQLQNYIPVKSSQTIFIILYLLPNDDEQRQTQSSTTGIFNEHFHFPLKSDELLKRTLRLTVYTVDSITRIRHILGHVFIKFDQFLSKTQLDKTFSTKTLSESLIQDSQIRSDYLGEVLLTTTYLKDENLIQINIQQINHLHIELSKTKSTLKAHFSGQVSNTCQKRPWTNTSTFVIPSCSSFRIDQQLNLLARSSVISTNEDNVQCHLRLHIHSLKKIHSHARWQHSLRSNLSQTIIVPLIAME